MAFNRASTGLASRIFRLPAARLALLKSAWPLAVGPELARRTEVLAVEGRTLRVRVPDTGWRKVLHRMQPQIVARLRGVAGELGPARLGFSEGQVISAPEVRTTPSPSPSAPIRVDPALAEAAERIPDAELRAVFMSAASRYLSRRQRPGGEGDDRA